MAQIMPVDVPINKTALLPIVPAPVFNHGSVKLRLASSFAAVTLEKRKLDMTTITPKESVYTPIEVSNGGGNGNSGKGIGNGNSGGGGGNGDNDDYFGNPDEGEKGGLFRTRMILEELFDRKFLDAVLNEWQRTVMDLPSGLRQAVEMGLVSSAQMVRFLAVSARPTTERLISRILPEGLSRAFIGRMIADPAFLYKLLLDQAATIGCSVWCEVENRKHRLKHEWHLALLNVLTTLACNTFFVWSLAPCRSYGNTFQYDLQNTLQKLPNNIFEKSYPLREFDMQKRIYSLVYNAAMFFTVGGIQAASSTFLAGKKDGRLSVTINSVGINALRYGAFLGIYANLRYQMVCGIDRLLINRFDVIGVALFFSTALRILNVQLGEISKLAWYDGEVEPLVDFDDLLSANIRRTETDSTSSSNPFIFRTTLLKRLGLLGIGKQEYGEAPIPTPKRKRVARKAILRS